VPYSQIKLVSFDLDNTLYDNVPVISFAEQQSRNYLKAEFKKQNRVFDHQLFVDYRNQLVSSEKNLRDDQPSQYENLSYLRQQVLLHFCEKLENSLEIANQAFELFIKYRNIITIETHISVLLKQLEKKYILVSVTNGNCEVNKLSIGNLFKENYSPLTGYRAKPHPQMLNQIIKDFNLEASQVIHIGDRDDSDGLAAKQAGCLYYRFEPFIGGRLDIEKCKELVRNIC